MKVPVAIFGKPVQVNKSTMKVSRGQWHRLKGLIGRTGSTLASTNGGVIGSSDRLLLHRGNKEEGAKVQLLFILFIDLYTLILIHSD